MMDNLTKLISRDGKLFWILFSLMIVIQLAVPAYMIYTSEETQSKGKVYKFELQAIDPYDPFRGKYLILNPKENFLPGYQAPCVDCSLYAYFTEDRNGYAQLVALTTTQPNGTNYLEVSCRSNDTTRNASDDPGTVIAYPFYKYFMNEHKAKPAEDLIRKVTRDSTLTTYAEVSILKGKAQVLNIMIGDNKLLDLLDKEE